MILVARLVETNLRADRAVKVVAPAVDPGVIGAELDRGDTMGSSNALAGVPRLDGVDGAGVFDAQRSR
jgi:hypothetical protein